MRTNTSIALASILMLGFAGTPPAQAGAPTSTAPIQLLGKRVCLPTTPPTTACDVRLTPPAPPTMRIFGQTWCLGPTTTTARCDVRVPAAQPATASTPAARDHEPVLTRWLRALRGPTPPGRG
ncbi:MAG: hypothetical protein IPL61_13350 [Myxococcales bacterium]|nr:hypothetical protein [Myxococcales bacterium]